MIGKIREEEWKPLLDEEGKETGKEWTEFIHCMNNTKKAFRIVVTREKISQQTGMFEMGYRYHAMATNVDEWSGPEVIEWYSRRGNAENLIKETKIGFGLEYLPFSSFRGNAVWFATGLLSYNVAVAMRNLVLPEVYRDKEIETIRYWIYSVPAWIVEHGRKVYWALSCDKRQFEEIKGIRNRCLASGFGQDRKKEVKKTGEINGI